MVQQDTAQQAMAQQAMVVWVATALVTADSAAMEA